MRTFILGLAVLGLLAVTSCPPAQPGQYDGAGQLLPTPPQPESVTIIVPTPTYSGTPVLPIAGADVREIQNRPYGGLLGGPYGSLLGAPK